MFSFIHFWTTLTKALYGSIKMEVLLKNSAYKMRSFFQTAHLPTTLS